jgi:predicted ATPase
MAGQELLEDGIAYMSRGLRGARETGSELMRPMWLGVLAEAHGKAGRPAEGLDLLSEAKEVAEKADDHSYEAELCRLEGELSLLVGRSENEAEKWFRRGIDVARRQEAKSLELRAVMSLSRLWQKQGKKEEARKMLADIYGWFTEGFDTADLKEAKALLDELA